MLLQVMKVYYIIPLTGRGVFAEDFIPKGAFIVQYRGKQILEKEIDKSLNEIFLYQFRHDGKNLW